MVSGRKLSQDNASYEAEGPEFNPKNPHKHCDMHPVSQNWGSAHMEVPGASWFTNLSKSVNSRSREKPFFKNKGGDWLKKTSVCAPI